MLKKISSLLAISIILGGCMSASPANNQYKNEALTAPPTTVPATNESSPSGTPTSKIAQAVSATIETNKGSIILKLYPETAPKTVVNFISKAKNGFYNNLIFHRYEPGFVIQGGDPEGTGMGGGNIPTELSKVPFKEGSLGIARGGNIEISNDSQFFICLATDTCSHLTGQYTNYGEVTKGMDVVNALREKDVIKKITIKE